MRKKLSRLETKPQSLAKPRRSSLYLIISFLRIRIDLVLRLWLNTHFAWIPTFSSGEGLVPPPTVISLLPLSLLPVWVVPGME